MSLYHELRPKTLDTFVGNQSTISALKSYLNNPKKIPNCFLFCGPTGCGKTTLGRIIKNFLGVSDEDFNEINSSEMRGIDTIRELHKNIQFSPLNSPKRIYLIDECHKLTNDAQNAFLKDLEDTPKHIMFILCTTEPEKLIKAIKGRCQIFQLSPLTEKESQKLINQILGKVKINLPEKQIEKIIELSEGRPREMIQLLEKLIHTEEKLRERALLKTEKEQAQSIELCRALFNCNGNWKKVNSILIGLKESDAETLRRMVLGYASAILLKSDNPMAGLVLENFSEPFYNTGFPGLVLACYLTVKNP